jgi:hypothetical protein
MTLPDRVRAAVTAGLPNHMHPARVLLVDRLPLLPGGKLDIHALLTIDAATPGGPRIVSFRSMAAVGTRHAFARALLHTLARLRGLAGR